MNVFKKVRNFTTAGDETAVVLSIEMLYFHPNLLTRYFFMAINFITSNPKSLLASFDARINQKELSGKIITWEKSDDGKYYTHIAPEWNKRAWLSPKIALDQLTFNIIKPKNANVNTTVYAYYHAHLIETFLNHFDQSFTNAFATALAVSGDHVSS